MSLSESLEEEANSGQSRVTCKTCQWLEGTTPENRQAFSDHIEEGGTKMVLLRALRREGLIVSETALRRHLEVHHAG